MKMKIAETLKKPHCLRKYYSTKAQLRVKYKNCLGLGIFYFIYKVNWPING